jgi:hypothetical protein
MSSGIIIQQVLDGYLRINMVDYVYIINLDKIMASNSEYEQQRFFKNKSRIGNSPFNFELIDNYRIHKLYSEGNITTNDMIIKEGMPITLVEGFRKINKLKTK